MENGGLEKQVENEAAKKTDSKANRRDKKKNKKKEIEDASKVISEIRDSSGKNSGSEDDDEFWMPPVGARWDNDDGGDRWGSGSESEEEEEDAIGQGIRYYLLVIVNFKGGNCQKSHVYLCMLGHNNNILSGEFRGKKCSWSLHKLDILCINFSNLYNIILWHLY